MANRSTSLLRRVLFAAISLCPLTGRAQTAPKVEGPEPPPDAMAAVKAESEARAAHEAAEANEREALRNELQDLKAQIESERSYRSALEASLASRVDTLTVYAEQPTPTVSTARLGLSLTGYVQADMALRQSSQDQLNPSGVPLNQDTFFVRRARLRAVLERSWAAGALEIDGNTVNGPTARLIGAEASLKWPAERGAPPIIMATIGAFKIPFGFEIGQSDRERLFIDRSTAERALFPGEFDLGVRLMGGWRFVRYAVAIQNGNPIGDRGGFAFRDPNQAKDVSGRVGIDTPVSDRISIAGGFSGLSGKGFHPGTTATKPVVVWTDNDGNGAFNQGEINVIPGTAATPSQNFTRFAFGGDLRLGINIESLGALLLYGELYWAKNLDRAILPADPISFGRDYREFGVYAGITQELGEHASVGFRYDFYNPDNDSTNQVMGAQVPTALAYQTFAIAAALRAPSGRLIAEFDVNRNHNGRDVSGNPTNLKDNAFFIRGEASF
jgi:hypothetical protein